MTRQNLIEYKRKRAAKRRIIEDAKRKDHCSKMFKKMKGGKMQLKSDHRLEIRT